MKTISILSCLLLFAAGCKSASSPEEPEVTRATAETSFSMRLDTVAACFGWHGNRQLAMFHESLQWDIVPADDEPGRPFEVEMTARVWAPVFSKVMGKARFAFDKESMDWVFVVGRGYPPLDAGRCSARGLQAPGETCVFHSDCVSHRLRCVDFECVKSE